MLAVCLSVGPLMRSEWGSLTEWCIEEDHCPLVSAAEAGV